MKGDARGVGVYDVWCIWQPPCVDSLSWPALLHGVHAGTELACLSYVMEGDSLNDVGVMCDACYVPLVLCGVLCIVFLPMFRSAHLI